MDTKQWAEHLLSLANITLNGDTVYDPKIHNNQLYARVMAQGSLGLGESYMDAWWDCQELDDFFYRLLSARIQDKIGFSWPLAWHVASSKLINLQKTSRAFQVGQKHYDLGNHFFQTMLGPSMAYSCGYWREATDLDSAQFAKFDLICRKLNLQKGERILDIGSGWGGFAKYAAEHYGVFVMGVTVSKEQAAFAKDLCQGLPCTFSLQDYRTLNEKFDHIVSVGMFEHVGQKNYKTYLEVAKRCLKEDGLFLLHTIGSPLSHSSFDPWMHKYIFPNAQLPSLAQISSAAENLFVIEDVHNFGPDYDKTLMAWNANFQKHWPEFKNQYDQRFYRMWQYYLLSCAGGFRARTTELWQLVLSPKGVAGGYKSVR